MARQSVKCNVACGIRGKGACPAGRLLSQTLCLFCHCVLLRNAGSDGYGIATALGLRLCFALFTRSDEGDRAEAEAASLRERTRARIAWFATWEHPPAGSVSQPLGWKQARPIAAVYRVAKGEEISGSTA